MCFRIVGTALLLDLAATVTLYRLFGKTGLQVAIATAIILANLQGPKLTIIFGFETTLGVIFYSSIFFATDVLSENYGRAEANKAVRMGFAVSLIVLVILVSLVLPTSVLVYWLARGVAAGEPLLILWEATRNSVFVSALAAFASVAAAVPASPSRSNDM